MNKAAAVLFVSLNGNALFLKRSAKAGDCVGCWDFPGGSQEGDETAEQTAVREAREEIGFLPDGERHLHTRQKMGSAPGTGAVGLGAPPVIPVAGGAPTAAQGPAPVAQPAPNYPNPVDYTTFLQRCTNEFVPELNDEHDGWAWAPVTSPPEPLHPGCRIALERIGMDELGIARAMAEGRMISPQHYENVTLFAIRITGTDVAYRKGRDEFVYRPPEKYLNDEFLARCNGLPVVYVQRSKKDPGFHPVGALLNSHEYSERVVGSIFLPYIAGNEVWGIAKIYDDAAANDMEEKDLSTSPAVFFRDAEVNSKMTLEDGSTLLIEGKPSLLDHVAVCEKGVWDKGGEPTGVRSEAREDSSMTDEEKKAAEAKAAAEAEAGRTESEAKIREAALADAEDKGGKDEGDEKKEEREEEQEGEDASADAAMSDSAKLDAIAQMLDSMSSRMDALEAADAAFADEGEESEEERRQREEEEKKKQDAEAKAKADADDIRKRIDEVRAMIPKNVADADYHAMTDAQARADEVYADFGKSAPRPLNGETPVLYERRCVRELKQFSPSWKDVDFKTSAAYADDAGFSVIRDQVYKEAKVTALNPINVTAGTLRMIEKKRDGHTERTFVGEPRTWMDPMAGAVQLRGTGSFANVDGTFPKN